MMTDREVKQQGLGALIDALGEVHAERFITLLNREPLDYTTWQKNLFLKLDVFDISTLAMQMQKQFKVK